MIPHLLSLKTNPTPLHSTPLHSLSRSPLQSPMDSSPSSSSGEAVMAALLRLPARAFSDLTRALAADLRLQRRRLFLLLLSPLHFSRALAHLHSLSLPEKTLLLARLLLHHLHSLLPSLSGTAAAAHRLHLLDLDAALLLLAMCDAYDSDRPHADWHTRIAEYAVAAALSPAGLGAGGWAVLGHYVDTAAKCRRLFEVVSREGGKVGAEVAAAAAAVVALPSVECRSRGRECVICKEEMEVGRDVCELARIWRQWHLHEEKERILDLCDVGLIAREERERRRREKGTRAWAMDGVEDAEALGLP